MTNNSFITVKKAAAEYELSEYFIRQAIKKGLIPVVQMNPKGKILIIRDKLENLLREGAAV